MQTGSHSEYMIPTGKKTYLFRLHSFRKQYNNAFFYIVYGILKDGTKYSNYLKLENYDEIIQYTYSQNSSAAHTFELLSGIVSSVLNGVTSVADASVTDASVAEILLVLDASV